jgi:hypothetical protein
MGGEPERTPVKFKVLFGLPVLPPPVKADLKVFNNLVDAAGLDLRLKPGILGIRLLQVLSGRLPE